MSREFTFLQSKLHAILNAIANGVKLSRLTLDQDKSRLPTQPSKEESLEDVVCYLILLALDGDGLGGDCQLTKIPRTLQILNSDTRLRSIGSVVREGKLLKLEIAITNALLKQMPSEHLTKGESGFILKAIADQGLDLKITATGTK